jgi:hypothetical protein
VLGRARNDTRDSRRAAVVNTPADTQGFESLSAAEREIWERAMRTVLEGAAPVIATSGGSAIRGRIARARKSCKRCWRATAGRSRRCSRRRISRRDRPLAALSLETVFHEAMHQWDDAMIPRLQDTAQRLHADIPRDLFHSRVVPGHRPYADPLWARGLPGHGALDRLVCSFAK